MKKNLRNVFKNFKVLITNIFQPNKTIPRTTLANIYCVFSPVTRQNLAEYCALWTVKRVGLHRLITESVFTAVTTVIYIPFIEQGT